MLVLLPTLLMGLILPSVSFASDEVGIVINGVDSASIEDNIKLFVRQVNLPVSEFDADDFEQKVIRNAEKAVQAFGYYNADIQVMPVAYQPDGNFTLTFTIDLNQITVVTAVVLQADYMTKPSAQVQNIPPKLISIIEQVRALQGKPLDHSQYESLKGQLSTFALLYGYFDFKFLLHKLLILPNANGNVSNATVHWLFNLGERYQFGDIVFLQGTRGQAIASSVKSFKKGEFFDQSKIGQYSIDLASTGYFDNAIARANAEKAVDKMVPVELILTPKPIDTYQFGVGFSTDTKARISMDWKRPWVNEDGHSLGASLYLSNPRKSLSLDYRIPKANPLNDFLNYRVSFKQTDENQTQSENLGFEVLRQWGAQEDGWDKIGFLKIEQESFIQGLQERQSTRLVMPGFIYNRTRKDGDIFVNWGDRQQLTIQGASKSVLSDIDFFKVLAKTKWIRQFDKHRITLRADAGAIATNDFARVPATQRFFAGGDQSIRGFGFNEVSEIELIEVDGETLPERLGGKYLAVASVEYAYNINDKWRIAAFVDAGSANNTFASDIATGVGIGVHWLSPIGNVQVYIAHGNSSFDQANRIHLIIGPGL
ncbi:MAG: translocation and assembly module TamA [Kangiellaceae bacterium]|jgi:translocation and assembly module TamA